MEQTKNTSKLIISALLIGLEIIFTRFLSIMLPFIRIGFGFLPISVIAILYGPLWAGTAYALGDILGMLIFPAGPYFPGFTFTAFCTGVVYGLVLHKKEITLKRVCVAACFVCIVLNLGLDTFWLYMLYDTGVIGFLPTRLLKCVIMIPLQTMTIYFLYHRCIKRLSFIRS